MSPGSGARSRIGSRLRRWWPRAWWKRVVVVGVVFMLIPVPIILACWVVQPPVTSVMIARIGQRIANGDRPIWPQHDIISRSKMSPHLRRAVLASEDDRFYLHFGIDTVELRNALERRKRGGRLRGASTLTQQVVKNIFLWNGRSYVRKGLEMYLALLMELLLSKERILDLYLNLAEWGPNAFGAEAAARVHYNKSAANLTRDEAARLAAILPSPRRWSPRGSVASARSGAILARMAYPAPHEEPKPVRRAR